MMSAAAVSLFAPLALACGTVLPNRIAKAAMEENLAAPGQIPDESLFRLYRAWSRGGAGLLVTGNVMVDRRALTGPAGVVLDRTTDLAPFERWAEAAKSGGSAVWMQISHPGRQVFAGMGMTSLSPSGVALDMGRYSKMFEKPREMSPAEIVETIERFVDTAVRAERAGFDGVEIHAAHGYLVSQFLSPLSNRRTDEWGGSLENRARLLLAIVDGVRATVAPGFAVAVKLNSADFQRGGFDERDAGDVVRLLNGRGVDLIELSGGNYESPAMQGQTADSRTLAREAYFLTFAVALLEVAEMPFMVTGGITMRETAEAVVASGVAVAGIGTALALHPDLPNEWRTNERRANAVPQLFLKDKSLRALATMAYIGRRLRALGAGRPAERHSPAISLVLHQIRRTRKARQYKKWLSNQQ